MTDGVCPFAEWIPGVTTISPGNGGRVGFCDHAAGGFLSTMRRASFWNGAGVSTHFAIGRGGEVVQLVNIFDTAFAQGRLGSVVTWPPYDAMGRANPNLYLISTEHEDAVTVNGQTVFVPGSEWTPAQYAADLDVKRWCRLEVQRVMGADVLRFGLDSLAGHHMFDNVNRAECPGRYWRDEYRTHLYADLSGIPQQEDPDMMIPHNAKASWFDMKAIGKGGPYTMQARTDLSLPPEASMVRLDVYMDAGPITFRTRQGLVAGVIEDGDRHAVVDVALGSDGTCTFECPADCRIRLIGALGYWI